MLLFKNIIYSINLKSDYFFIYETKGIISLEKPYAFYIVINPTHYIHLVFSFGYN